MKLYIKSKAKNIDAVGEYNIETGEFIKRKCTLRNCCINRLFPWHTGYSQSKRGLCGG